MIDGIESTFEVDKEENALVFRVHDFVYVVEQLSKIVNGGFLLVNPRCFSCIMLLR